MPPSPVRQKRRVLPLLFLLLTACPSPDPSQEPSSMTEPALSFLALGDSYTIGERVDSIQRWPVQLARSLRESGLPISDPLIIARTGWTTDELSEGIRAEGPPGDFDLVSLLIGVNNQYRGRDVEEYRVQLRDLLNQALAFAGGRPERVLVLSIPDWGVMPFAEGRDREAIATEIDDYNRVKAQEVEALGILFVDITGISRRASSDPSLVAEDGLHPSGLQYSLWVEAALPVAEGLLQGSR